MGGPFLDLKQVNETTSSNFESESLDEVNDLHIGRLETLELDITPKASTND